MKIRTRSKSTDIQFSSGRIDRNIREAQKLLNLQVAADCDPLIPFQQGALRNSVTYPDGIYGGTIQWGGEEVGVPYAHLQYVGEVYGPNYPRKDSDGNVVGWYSPPNKHPTGRPLTYHTPGTGKEWFEVAKQRKGKQWIDLVKKTVGKG